MIWDQPASARAIEGVLAHQLMIDHSLDPIEISLLRGLGLLGLNSLVPEKARKLYGCEAAGLSITIIDSINYCKSPPSKMRDLNLFCL